MMQTIFSDFRRYNANSRDRNSPDCVKRALCIAYGIDYDQVSNELNSIKRELRYDKFNISPVFNTFIYRHGYTNKGKPHAFELPASITVDEFCSRCNSGIYLMLVGPSSETSTHMVAVIDGDFWDSWDCSSYVVNYIYQISSDSTSNISTVLAVDIKDAIFEHVHTCLDKYIKKMPWATFTVFDFVEVDEYTLKQEVMCTFGGDLVKDFRYYSVCQPAYTYTIKVNPRNSLESNLRTIQEKLRVRLREWAYAIRKQVEDDIAANQLKLHKSFCGDETLLLKIPEWCRSRVFYINDTQSKSSLRNDDIFRLTMQMEALPEDPRSKSDPVVSFYADTIPELRHAISIYKDKFLRYEFDY